MSSSIVHRFDCAALLCAFLFLFTSQTQTLASPASIIGHEGRGMGKWLFAYWTPRQPFDKQKKKKRFCSRVTVLEFNPWISTCPSDVGDCPFINYCMIFLFFKQNAKAKKVFLSTNNKTIFLVQYAPLIHLFCFVSSLLAILCGFARSKFGPPFCSVDPLKLRMSSSDIKEADISTSELPIVDWLDLVMLHACNCMLFLCCSFPQSQERKPC
jgi:hypothetical protein